MTPAQKMQFYWKQHRQLTALARRSKYMIRDDRHEVWAEKARAAYMLAMIERDEAANERRG